jgi:hypothetical protein
MSETQEEPANRLESLALALIFAAVSLALLALIGVATRHGQASGGWWTRPAFFPGTALGLLAAANVITVWRDVADLRAHPATAAERAEARVQVLRWLRPFEFLAYYAAYIWLIQIAGYFPSTLGFVMFLLWRVGLTAPQWLLAGLGLSLFMIAVFRAGLGVWMPAPGLYDLFPDGVRMALLRWF